MPPASLVAVLTGDLIKSSQLSTKELGQVRKLVLDTCKDFQAAYDKGTPPLHGKPEFFRGDSWQAALVRPGLALRLALLLQSRLHHQGLSNTRIAIGLGPTDKLDAKRISLSTGEAFLLSGRALDDLPRYSALTIALSEKEAPELARWLPVVSQLCHAILDNLTKRQAEILALAAHPSAPTHQEIAEQLEISRPTVTVALDALHWPNLEDMLIAFEAQFPS
jgi:DNA-binding CsgD family transcriptional regulator